MEEAIQNGASIVIYDNNDPVISDERAILTEDTVAFMQKLARDYRKSLGIKVVAITGSNGKTTTKDMGVLGSISKVQDTKNTR